MNKNKNFIFSLINAFSGIITALRCERNMRFHFMIANLIIIFAYFFGLSKIEWAVLLLTICLVFCTEIINTAVENAVNTATDKYNEYAKISKDAASGAVLVSAIFSLIIGFVLFFDTNKIAATLTLIFTSSKYLIPCLAVGISNLLFLISKDKKIKKGK